MKSTFFITSLGLMLIGFGFANDAERPAAKVMVKFEAPENYTDVKDAVKGTDRERDSVLAHLKEQFDSQASHFLSAGQRLEIIVSDIDLAGAFEPWRGMDFAHVRILREVYPPRMDLTYRLFGADGELLNEGTRHLQSLGYLMTMTLPGSDPLRYEKNMIRSWLRREFARSP